MTQVSFEGVTSFEPLDAGKYQATFSEFKVIEKSKSSGKPFVAITFSITEEGLENRKVWRNYSLQPQSLFALKNLMEVMGANVDMEGAFDLEAALQDLIGTEVVVEVGVREYNGKPSNEVTGVSEGRLF